jgi:magnesium-transporting ATPase (P-type)
VSPINSKTRRRVQGAFLGLTLLSLAAGSTFLTLIWFSVGVTNGTDYVARGLAFIVIWPMTMLAVLIFGSAALVAARRLRTVPLYAVLWLGVLVASWSAIIYLLTQPAVAFLVVALGINIAAILAVRRIFYDTSGVRREVRVPRPFSPR